MQVNNFGFIFSCIIIVPKCYLSRVFNLKVGVDQNNKILKSRIQTRSIIK